MEFAPADHIGTSKDLLGFAKFVVPKSIDQALLQECVMSVKGWSRRTLRIITIGGGAGWVDPVWTWRHMHYRSARGNRHSYMVALAHLEDAISPEVLKAMDKQKYQAHWDGRYRDLCSLIAVVQQFMADIVKVSAMLC